MGDTHQGGAGNQLEEGAQEEGKTKHQTGWRLISSKLNRKYNSFKTKHPGLTTQPSFYTNNRIK